MGDLWDIIPKNDRQVTKHLQRAARKSAQPVPNPSKIMARTVEERTIAGMQTFICNDQQDVNQKLVLYLHGGAYVSQPLTFHYHMLRELVDLTDVKLVMPIYPKAPQYSYQDSFPKLLALYQELLEQLASPSLISLVGDSAGGGLAFGLAHLLFE